MNGAPKPPAQRKPRRRWRWHVPPALVHGSEALEGAEVLDEISGAQGLLLWQTMRDVTLWAGVAEPEERAHLFGDGAGKRRLEALAAAGLDAELDLPLRALARVPADPAGVAEADVLAACRQVSEWAERRGRLATALAFAQAAAIAAPANAAAGFRVGQLARRRGDTARAETWFRRTIGLGRQAKDWASYAEAFLGLGNLYAQRGALAGARRLHIRGLRAARRHAMRDIQGRALHHLFAIALETGDRKDAQDLARAAYRAYGPHHPRLPLLAHDLAHDWMLQGRFAPALQVFQALLPKFHDPAERVPALADLARAAGGAADRGAFERAWDELWPLAHERAGEAVAARALLDLAHGAASLGEWTRAETAAGESRQMAERRGEGKVAAEAESVLESVRAKRAVESTLARSPEGEEEAEGFAGDLVRVLGNAR